jgi:hypothetical protein
MKILDLQANAMKKFLTEKKHPDSDKKIPLLGT